MRGESNRVQFKGLFSYNYQKVLMIFSGFLDLPWWGLVLVALGLTHVTIASVTIFLHRHQAHRALDLHPIASHFFRFWLWMNRDRKSVV